MGHSFIEQLRRIEKEATQVSLITNEEGLCQRFLNYVEYYTGNKRDLKSFIDLVRHAMNEIVNGAYIAEDRESLYDHLCELEYWILTIHFSRFNSLFPWGLTSEYRIKSDTRRIPEIMVPLEQHRQTQYNQLCYRELQEKYQALLKEKRELENE